MKQFQRGERYAGRNKLDGIGTVIVTVTRRGADGRQHLKGNIMRTLSISHTKVSTVIAAIEKALFND